jgi:hypothetical protein
MLSEVYEQLEREVFAAYGLTMGMVYARIASDPAAFALGEVIQDRACALVDGGAIPARIQDDPIIGEAAKALCDLVRRPRESEAPLLRTDGTTMMLVADLAATGCAVTVAESGDLRVEFHNEEEKSSGRQVLRSNGFAA